MTQTESVMIVALIILHSASLYAFVLWQVSKEANKRHDDVLMLLDDIQKVYNFNHEVHKKLFQLIYKIQDES